MNNARIGQLLNAAQVVLVLGPSRSGVSLAAAQLAQGAEACLLESSSDLVVRWLQSRSSDVSLSQQLALDLEKTIIEIHGPQRLHRPIRQVVMPLRQSDWSVLSTVAKRIDPGHLVLLDRQPADLLCSLARFPHLHPWLPCPRENRLHFLQAALQMLEQQQTLLAQLCQQLTDLGFVAHRLAYEELVAAGHLPSALRQHLCIRDQDATPLAGISPSLVFRERPLDQSSVGRWRRQLHAEEIRSLGTDQIHPPLHSSQPADPIILTGRGGSGTRLLAEAVISQGVDLGSHLNPSSDSIQWADLLYEMSLGFLRDINEPWSGSWADELRHRASCLSAQRPLSKPWGFKLPEVMLVAEPLLQAWPGSTIVHLIRHPLDTCLRRTHMTSRTSNPVGKALLAEAYRVLGRRRSPDDDPPHLRNAVSWWYQIQEIHRVRNEYPARFLELRYEDLCDHPQATTHRLMQALGLPSRPFSLPVDPLRRRRWQAGDERVAEVWALCGPLAEASGYSPDY